MTPADRDNPHTPLELVEGLIDEERQVRALRHAVDKSLALIRSGAADPSQAEELRQHCRRLAIQLFGSEAASKFDLIYAPRFARAIQEITAGLDGAR